jgi:hypothetical protein
VPFSPRPKPQRPKQPPSWIPRNDDPDPGPSAA